MTAAKDKTVDNDTINEYFSLSKNGRRKLIDFPEADHMTITFDYEITTELAQMIIEYFDSFIQVK